MFDHVLIRAADRAASERFYRTTLDAIGRTPTRVTERLVVFGEFMIVGADDDHPPTTGLHLGFGARSRAQVDAFWGAGVEAGYRDDGPPGPRPIYGDDYYGAFLLDPDGNSVEAVQLEAPSDHAVIDHLWIGAADRDRAAAFYRTIADAAGLRVVPVGEDRVSCRGDGASFSLVADGRPPTRGLHLAFPAPNRATVDSFHAEAIAAGYRDNGAPGARPRYGSDYYGAFVFDPDGCNVESVCHTGA